MDRAPTHPEREAPASATPATDVGDLGEHRRRPLQPHERVVAAEIEARLFPDLAQGSIDTLGRYRVVRRLGAGGMGVVFEAHDPRLDRRVAIKILHDEGNAHARARLFREAQMLAGIEHPNIVRVFDVGFDEDGDGTRTLYVVMELVLGTTLSEWLYAQRSWREVMRIFLRAAEGLAAAHASGIHHRDFKPGNVLLDERGVPRVADFGLARAADEDAASGPAAPPAAEPRDEALTQAGSLLGTPGYMPPEQFDGKSVDARCDQYAFCVSLWEGLTRQRPFVGATLAEVRWQQARPPEIPVGSDVPRRIFMALRRGLAFDPDARWPSLRALLDELDASSRRAGARWGAAVTVAALALLGLVLPVDADRDPPRRDAASPGEASRIGDDVAGVLARAAAGERSGEYRAALMDIDAVLARDDATRTQHERASLDLHRGVLLARLGRYEDAEAALSAAFFAAAELDADAVAGRAALELCGLRQRDDDLDAAASWLEHADAHVSSAGDPVLLARLRHREGQLESARDPGPTGPTRLREAVAALQRLGPEAAPEHADALASLGQALLERGDHATAEEVLHRAVAGWQALAEGSDHAGSARAYGLLARAAAFHERFDEAVSLQRRVIEVWSPHNDLHPQVAWAHNNLGNLHLAREQHPQARPELQRALALFVEIHGSDHPNVAAVHENLGALEIELGNHADALVHLERARVILEGLYGAEHRRVGHVLANVGRALHGLGRHDRATLAYRESLAILERAAVDPVVRARIHALLADTLDAAGDRDAAIAAAHAAASLYQKSGPPGAHGLHDVTAWLAARDR